MVPPEVEYEETPRGRAGYNKREERYWLRADRCILKKKGFVSKIMKAMHLPPDTTTETDPHYRCARCLSRQRGDDLIVHANTILLPNISRVFHRVVESAEENTETLA